MFKIGAAVLDREQFVNLLLIFDHGKARLGMVEDVVHLFGDSILIKRHRNPTHRLNRGNRPIQMRPVIANHSDLIATSEPELMQPERHCAHIGGDLKPGPRLPDPVALLADSCLRST